MCNGSTPDSDSVCGGSNPSSSAKNIRYPSGYLIFFYGCEGFEPILMQHSCGVLLPPVQKLVASLIKSNPSSSAESTAYPSGYLIFFCGCEGFEPILTQHPCGVLLPPVQKLVASLIKSNPPSPVPPSIVGGDAHISPRDNVPIIERFRRIRTVYQGPMCLNRPLRDCM